MQAEERVHNNGREEGLLSPLLRALLQKCFTRPYTERPYAEDIARTDEFLNPELLRRYDELDDAGDGAEAEDGSKSNGASSDPLNATTDGLKALLVEHQAADNRHHVHDDIAEEAFRRGSTRKGDAPPSAAPLPAPVSVPAPAPPAPAVTRATSAPTAATPAAAALAPAPITAAPSASAGGSKRNPFAKKKNRASASKAGGAWPKDLASAAANNSSSPSSSTSSSSSSSSPATNRSPPDMQGGGLSYSSPFSVSPLSSSASSSSSVSGGITNLLQPREGRKVMMKKTRSPMSRQSGGYSSTFSFA